jgi:hypothetical protein
VDLTAAFILLWSRLMMKQERLTCALSALCLGLALLTKVDTALAAVAVALVGVISTFFVRTKDSKFRAADALLFGGMVAAPAAGFFIYFLTYMPIGRALAAVGGGLSIASNEVAALPEGIMLNYLTRRATSLPVINFMMTELIIFGEDRILEDFKARPPEYGMLVHKDTAEWGGGPFGADPKNGRQIMRWVSQNHSPVALIACGEKNQAANDDFGY